MSAYSLRKLASIGLGDHLCCLFDTEEEHRVSIASFVRQGLERDEKVLYAFDARDPDAILECLLDDGLDVENALSRNQLTLVAGSAIFAPEGVLDPDATIARLQEETERALAEGFQGLRFTVEMTWAWGRLQGSERVVEYESKLNGFLPGSRCTALCQYDRRRFDPVAQLNVLVTHPIAILGTQAHDNFYYMPMADFLGHDLPAGALQFWLENLAARKRDLESLKTSEERFRSVVQTASDAMICTDERKNVVFWNRAAEGIFGYSSEEMVGKPIELIIPEQSRHVVQEAMDRLVTAGPPEVLSRSMDLLGKRKDGAEFPAELSLATWRTVDGVFFTGIVRDTTERKRQEQQLAFLATHDPLTGLPNRRSLEEALGRAIARASRGMVSTLMLLDVDNFKLINDTLGHAAGDQCLVALTRLAQEKLRASDLIVRLGGDEFAVLLDGTNVEDGLIVAERMRQAVEEFCFNLDGMSFNLSISIGLAAIDGKKTPVFVLSQVDGAMYKAKERGRNRVVVLQSEEDGIVWLSEANRLARRLKDALKEQLFLLYYQPVARLSNRKVEYYEALVRLCGDNGEIITAAEFIPAAERFGLMPQLTRWVAQRVIWTLKQRSDIRLSMNISFLDLSDEALPDFIEARLRELDVEPGRLGFEISEVAVARDLLLAEHWLQRLKMLGCHLSLDNFGTAYLSFARLQSLPVDYLKIDGSFIRPLENDLAQRALVQAMQTLARSQGKEIVAGCVESDSTARILEEIGITYGQGFCLGKPNPSIPHNGNGNGKNGKGSGSASSILQAPKLVVVG